MGICCRNLSWLFAARVCCRILPQEFAVGIRCRNLPWLFAARLCCRNLPWEFAVGICHKNLLQKFAMGICHRNLPWLFAVGCVCTRILFCICEQILFICKQTFFICEQIFLFVKFSFLTVFLFVIAVAVMGHHRKHIFNNNKNFLQNHTEKQIMSSKITIIGYSMIYDAIYSLPVRVYFVLNSATTTNTGHILDMEGMGAISD